jgi:hypothetical protein
MRGVILVAEGDDLELIDLLQELRQRHGVAASYARLWAAVTSGQIPACRVGRRWKVSRTHAPLAAR